MPKATSKKKQPKASRLAEPQVDLSKIKPDLDPVKVRAAAGFANLEEAYADIDQQTTNLEKGMTRVQAQEVRARMRLMYNGFSNPIDLQVKTVVDQLEFLTAGKSTTPTN